MKKYPLTASVVTTLLLSIVSIAAASQTVTPAYAGNSELLTDLKCYATNDTTNPGRVTLKDQFGTETVDPGAFPFLCTSAVKNDVGTIQLLHWNAYPISGSEPDDIDPPEIILTDQFGTMTVDPGTVNGGFLMVPVVKEGRGDLSASHFKCYVITGTIDPKPVDLEDQFGLQTDVDPSPAVDFCTPAIKTLASGQSFGSLEGPHLICYLISGQEVDESVTVLDQFRETATDVPVFRPVVLYTLATKSFPVGGEILGIDTTALLVAGAFTNAYWILPMLGGIAGAVIAFTRAKRGKTN